MSCPEQHPQSFVLTPPLHVNGTIVSCLFDCQNLAQLLCQTWYPDHIGGPLQPVLCRRQIQACKSQCIVLHCMSGTWLLRRTMASSRLSKWCTLHMLSAVSGLPGSSRSTYSELYQCQATQLLHKHGHLAEVSTSRHGHAHSISTAYLMPQRFGNCLT